jgi:hypothetical protein
MQVSSTQHGENSKLGVNEARIVLDRPNDHAAMLTSLQGFDHLWNVTSVVSHGNIWILSPIQMGLRSLNTLQRRWSLGTWSS